MNDSGILSLLLADFDAAAFGERVGRTMLAEALPEVPELALVPEELCVQLLGAVGLRAVTDLIAAATMLLSVEGPEADPAMQALGTTVEGVRLALGMLSPDDVADRGHRERLALQGLDHLARIVTSWDNAQLAQLIPHDPENPAP